MSLIGNYPQSGKRFEKVIAWRGKVGIMSMSDNPAWQENFDKGLILHGERKF